MNTPAQGSPNGPTKVAVSAAVRSDQARVAPELLPYRPGVGVVLLNRDGLIFAGRRIDNPGPAWQMPQGGIDEGEDPRAAALRELVEETGIRPEIVEYLAETPTWLTYDLPPELMGRIWGGRWRGQRQKWFLFRFHGRDEDVAINASAHPEFSEWRWLDRNTLTEAIVPFKRALYEEIFRLFEPWMKGASPLPEPGTRKG